MREEKRREEKLMNGVIGVAEDALMREEGRCR